MVDSLFSTIVQARRIAYVWADLEGRIAGTGGALDLLQGAEGLSTDLGTPLVEAFPELVGNEDVLGEILLGETPRLDLELVNRETPKGDIAYLTLTVLPHRSPLGETVGWLLLAQDVTARGRLAQGLVQQRNELSLLQRELETANAELQRLSETKSRFVSITAHELRSPLTTMVGYLEMVLDGDFGELRAGQVEALQVVAASAERLLDITKQLLDVARIESGRVELTLIPTDLPKLVRQVVKEMHPLVEAKSLRLTMDLPVSLPQSLCDVTRSHQVLGNLLSNAVKYTPAGGHIEVRLASAEDEGFLEVAVSDTGVGMSPEDQDRLFTRFFRAESALQTEAGGAGLGLYITHALVELHGGRIWFESCLGEGSTFHVTFPEA